jgi:hypothetical protein
VTRPETQDQRPHNDRGWSKLRQTAIYWNRFSKAPTHLAATKLATFILYLGIFWITAAAAHSGYIGKWGLIERADRGNSIQRMLDGTADKPFVYRQLVPVIVNLADKYTNDWIRQQTLHLASRPSKIFVKSSLSNDPQYAYRYILVYYISFFALLLSLFVLYRILREWGMPESPALFAPIIFILAMPFLQTRGGYFYDSVELLFFSTAFWLAMQGRISLLIVLTIPATLNKETFLLFLPTLYPIVRRIAPPRAALIGVGAAMGLSGAIGLALKAIFASSAGAIRLKLSHHLTHHLSLGNYFRKELTYGVVGPRYLSIFTLVFVVIVVLRGWRQCSSALKQHIVVAAAINFSVFLLFGSPGELRNLSLLYVGFVCMLGYALDGTASALGRRVEPKNS